MGLLSKASSISNKNVIKLAFPNFISSHNIKFFAVFDYADNFYYISNSIGFDGASIIGSKSTKDFWDGICEEDNKVYSYDNINKNNNPILQFFTFELLESIKKVSLYKTSNNIYMLCNQDFNQNIIDDLFNIDNSYNTLNDDYIKNAITINSKRLNIKVDFKDAIDLFIKNNESKIDNKDIITNSLYNELSNRFLCYYCPYYSKKEGSFNLNCSFVVNNCITPEHLIKHLIFNLQKVIGNTSKLINFDYLEDNTATSTIKVE